MSVFVGLFSGGHLVSSEKASSMSCVGASCWRLELSEEGPREVPYHVDLSLTLLGLWTTILELPLQNKHQAFCRIGKV